LEQIFEVLNDFRVAAAEFKAKHRRHAMLVIENINVLADEAPWLLKDLQGLAKEVADERVYKIVFVTSDGTAPGQLRCESRYLASNHLLYLYADVV
jgi:hypothetical protein